MTNVTLSGVEYQVGPAKALPGLQAIGLIAKHLRVIEPTLSLFTAAAQDPATDWIALALSALETLQPLLSDDVGDVFRWLSLMSGIDQTTIENASLLDLGGIMSALAQENNLAGLLAVARGASRE